MDDSRTGQIEAIIFRKGSLEDFEYLMLKRCEAKGGFWQPVTGGIHKEETPKEALVREIEEELCIVEPEIIDIDYSFTFTLQSGKSLTEYVYGIKLAGGQGYQLSDEHTEARWVLLDEALNLLKWNTNKEALSHLDSYLRK